MNETRLVYRLRKLSQDERARFLERLPMSESTWFKRLNAPGQFTVDELQTIVQGLEQLDGADYDAFDMLQPVQLTTKANAA